MARRANHLARAKIIRAAMSRVDRHRERSEAIQRYNPKNWIASAFALMRFGGLLPGEARVSRAETGRRFAPRNDGIVILSSSFRGASATSELRCAIAHRRIYRTAGMLEEMDSGQPLARLPE